MKMREFRTSCTIGQFILITFLLVFSLGQSQAQSQVFELAPENPAAISVDGGSTLHDWTVKCQEVMTNPGQLQFSLEEGSEIASFDFSIEVKSMESGRGPIMNKKTYDAFKSEEHPHIKYQQTGPAKISEIGDDGSFSLISTGLLQMAGVEKEVSVNVSGLLKDGVLVFSGSHPMKMSDFDIEKPSAMFGQIKTKDDLTVNFEFRYLVKE